MSLKIDILHALQSSGTYVSGEELARRFGKSRAAVWKAVKSLQSDGYLIDAVTNRGYILTGDNDLITSDIIAPKLDYSVKVLYYPTVDSTNTQAKRLINDGEKDVILVVADEQTAGRGRQGKSFYSPPMTGIYMTLVVHPNKELQDAVTVTTAAGVAVCRAIEKLTDKKPQIKWVNDVYIGENKICGILTEAIVDFETSVAESMLVGIGTNIKTVAFPEDIENASCLDADVKRSDLIAAITNELMAIIDGGYKEFIDYYRTHSMLINRKINFIQNGKVTPATAIAIDESGGLVVRLEDGSETTLRSGEISVRKR